MITFEHVSKTYANGVKGLDQVDLTIGDGDFVAVIGLSGAGKSTFLRAINRLHDITEGDIRINGVSVTGAGKKQLRVIRRHIGMISQTFNLVKRSTVQKNVLSGRLGYYPTWKSILGIFSKEDYRLASEALEKVGLLDKLHSRSDELSGGQQQRVSIARTLVQQADIILADEPTGNLDSKMGAEVMELLHKLNKEDGRTIVMVTHNEEQARQTSRTVRFFDGRQVM